MAKKKPARARQEPLDVADMRVVYTPLAEVQRAPRNPKRHDAATMDASIERFGFNDAPTVDERTGRLVEGHGRIEALRRRKDAGKAPPPRVKVAPGGEWLVPIVRGVSFETDREAEAYLLAHNKIGADLWDEAELAGVLPELDLLGTGWSAEEAERIARGVEESRDERYTAKIKAPIYEPKMEAPPSLSALVSKGKAGDLLEDIDRAVIPDDVREFLRLAAARHHVFDYEQIAEFYAHAPKDVQRLMENSALVIIDFDKAIEQGFTVLTEELAEAYAEGNDEER